MTNAATTVFEILNPLAEDSQHVSDLLKTDRSSQFARRACVRTIITFVEAWVSTWKQVCVNNLRLSVLPFSLAEQALLREETYEVDDRGIARCTPRFVPLDRNVRFTVAAVGKWAGAEIELQVGDSGCLLDP